MDEPMDGWVGGWMDGQTDRLTDGKEGRRDGGMEGSRRPDGLSGRTDTDNGWVDGCTDRCNHGVKMVRGTRSDQQNFLEGRLPQGSDTGPKGTHIPSKHSAYPLKLPAPWGSSHLLQTEKAHVAPEKLRKALCF